MPDARLARRIGHALKCTVVVRGANGSDTIGLARLADVYGAWAIATRWNPPDQRNIGQIAKYGTFGLAVGVTVRLLLPGHHSIGMVTAIALSLAGALGGELAAERFLPAGSGDHAGFVASAIGALVVLLAYGIGALTPRLGGGVCDL